MDKVEENKIRRQAKRLGLILSKSKGKAWGVHNQLGYKIIGANGCLAGTNYELTFEQVKEWLDEYEPKADMATEILRIYGELSNDKKKAALDYLIQLKEGK